MSNDTLRHAAWEHDDSAELAPRAPNLAEVELKKLIERAHLPANPFGPALLTVLGIGYCIAIAHAFSTAHFGSRVETVMTLLIFSFAIVPGAWMLIGGGWALAESPLHYFAQRSTDAKRHV